MRILLWIARIWALIVSVFLVFTIAAHLIEAMSSNSEGPAFQSTSEMLSFLFFPLVLIGLFLAFKWEAIGGIITIAALIIQYSIRPDLIIDFWPLILTGPGILFIVHWLLKRANTNQNPIASKP